jgi:importin subunit beta-1
MWVKLEPQFKEQIKQAILFSLATPSTLVRTQVAAAIAAIAAIEIPRKEWTEIITSLSSNAQNDSVDIRNASL